MRGKGNEQLTSAISYGLVAVFSVLVVCGASLRDQFQRPAAPAAQAAPAAPVPGEPLPSRPQVVSEAVVPRAPQGAAPVVARATVEGSDVTTGALPAIPGAGATGQPEPAAAAPSPAKPRLAAPSEPPVIPARPLAPPSPAPATDASGSATPATSSPADAALGRARLLTRRLYDGRLQDVWAAFSPKVRAEWGSYQKFAAFRAGGREAYGAETGVLNEQLTRSGGVTYYTRTATFERGPSDGWTVILGLDSAGQVQEFGIVGAALLPQRLRELSQ
ncbi:hypothetical protein [Deinococcus koreensis]|uniref:DUF3887 domain-containing protein n=1 Tax=Deinococcus koreensis TaxID=2054903 RepID=A0A2K3UW24_9DEIO|nr:hypothetical protein [Deinococcus koreensis]PNY80720.1 hypothetical protein CVO96_04475 [Deinococcus koreensis]